MGAPKPLSSKTSLKTLTVGVSPRPVHIVAMLQLVVAMLCTRKINLRSTTIPAVDGQKALAEWMLRNADALNRHNKALRYETQLLQSRQGRRGSQALRDMLPWETIPYIVGPDEMG
ncbi:MAG: hypothetical protein Q9170_005566 [Blastenia crenularia]